MKRASTPAIYPCPVPSCPGIVIDDDADGIGYCTEQRCLVGVDEIVAKAALLVGQKRIA